ncbi:hypothetical protein IGK47_003610 [Enterococcus sp. AZ007]
MKILELFIRMMDITNNHLGSIYFIMVIIAILCIIWSVYLRMRKCRNAKLWTVTGLLLLVNPVIHLLFK